MFGIVSSTVLASVFMVVSYLGSAGQTVFNTLVFMSGSLRPSPMRSRRSLRSSGASRTTAPCTPAVPSGRHRCRRRLVFSILFIIYSRNTGDDTSVVEEYAPFLMAGVAFLIGIPVYLAQRER